VIRLVLPEHVEAWKELLPDGELERMRERARAEMIVSPAYPAPLDGWRRDLWDELLRHRHRRWEILRLWWTGKNEDCIRLHGGFYLRSSVDARAAYELRCGRPDPRIDIRRRWWPGWPSKSWWRSLLWAPILRWYLRNFARHAGCPGGGYFVHYPVGRGHPLRGLRVCCGCGHRIQR
jgi:hypothetical protein